MKKALIRIPILGRIILFFYRMKITRFYVSKPYWNWFRWLFTSKETTNFTYKLDPTSKSYLAALISDITNTPIDTIQGYFKEIEEDQDLKNHIQDLNKKSGLSFKSDKEVLYGRRIGWYAFVRVLKPKVVVETGVDKGMGSTVLCLAIKKNKEEGFEGKYYGTDINPNAGYLLKGVYAEQGEILYGDSIETLKNVDFTIDLFINDSDHSDEYEYNEYKTIIDKLSPEGIILGDNAHCTDKLHKFSLEMNRSFLYYIEKPYKHWYPGASIGVSFIRK